MSTIGAGGPAVVDEVDAWVAVGRMLREADRARFMRLLSIATGMVRAYSGYEADYPNAAEARRIVMAYATGGDRPEA